MVEFQPVCCEPAAFELMRRARERLETPVGLIEGALAIARHSDAQIDVEAQKHQLYEMGREVRSRVRGSQPQALLAHLHDYLFVELGFIGNTLNYHDAANSYLQTVLETRRGLPITLSLVYKVVGERAGLKIHGLGLPGHFCAGVEMPEGLAIIDPFYAGRILNQQEAHERIRDTYGSHVEWTEELLSPVTNRHWLTRIMQNLLHTYSERDRVREVAAMLEMELLLWPEQMHLQRDLALVLARLGEVNSASNWLTKYLTANPEDPQRQDLEQLLEVLSA
jgi:regulator of sirC expression with transglutaminase-like and TPR domain